MNKTTSIAMPLLLTLSLSTLFVGGCSKNREDPILRLSAVEALDQGKQLMEQEKYFRAQQYLTHAFEVEPNSRSGREALLLAGDSLYLHGGSENFIRCEAKYRDFLNRFPTSDRADYAQFRVAECLARRVEKPDRDQTVTRKALESFEELLRLYPTSPYVNEARQRILEVTDLLAAHELAVGHFHLRYGRGSLCHGAIQRLETVRDEYPDFTYSDTALFYLGMAYTQCRRTEDADAAFEELRRKFPESAHIRTIDRDKLPDRVGPLEMPKLDPKKKKREERRARKRQG